MTDGKEGFVHEVGDVDTLATNMRRLVEDRQLLSRLQAAARENSSNITWERAVDNLVRIYERRLLARRPQESMRA